MTIDPTQRAGIDLAALDLQEDILPSGAKTEIDIRLDGAVRSWRWKAASAASRCSRERTGRWRV